MKYLPLILGLSALVTCGIHDASARAPAPQPPPRMPGAFGVVTFTPSNGAPPWVDSGWVVEDHEYRDPNNIGGDEYTFRFVVFTDHVDEFHLDAGSVDIVYQ